MIRSLFYRSTRVGTLALGLSGVALMGAASPKQTTPPEPVAEQGTPLPGRAAEPEPGPLMSDQITPQPGRMGTATPAPKGAKATTPLAHEDVQFIQQAAENHMGELVLGFIALEKGKADEVKKHGHHLVDQAVKANKKLMEIAGEKNVFIPIDQLKLPTEELTLLTEKEGPEFDGAFITALLNDGTRFQGQLQSALGRLQDSDLKDLADGMLSRLNEGLSQARDLAQTLGVKTPPVGEPPLPKNEAAPMPGQPSHPAPSPEGKSLRPFDNPPGI